MSADNGYIIRVNNSGRYVLQMYWASNDDYPPLPEDEKQAAMFGTLEEAVRFFYNRRLNYDCEYGLSIDLSNEKKEEKKVMDIQKFVRRSFDVRAVQVTEDNLEEVTAWAHGDLQGDGDRIYISVKVKHPLNKRQTQAFVGDWVLKTQKGFKVYQDEAFKRNFQPYEDLSAAVRQNVFNTVYLEGLKKNDFVAAMPDNIQKPLLEVLKNTNI